MSFKPRRVALPLTIALILLVLMGCSAASSTPGSAPTIPPLPTPTPSTSSGSGAATAGGCPTEEAHLITGWVHSCNGHLADSSHHLVRLLSQDAFSLAPGAGRTQSSRCGHWAPPPSESYTNVRSHGLNSVELAVSWANLEPHKPTHRHGHLVHHWNRKYLKALDRIVAGYRQQGVAVVFSMLQSRWSPHFRDLAFPSGQEQACGEGMPPWLYKGKNTGYKAMVKAELAFFRNKHHVQKLFKAAWKKLAHHFRHNDSVIGGLILFEAYDLLAGHYPGTEGLRPADLRLSRFYHRIGKTIHKANKHLLIAYVDWQSFTSSAHALTKNPKVKKGLYSFEYYAPNFSQQWKHRLGHYYKRAKKYSDPAWIGEFTAFNYTRATNPNVKYDANWKEDTKSLLKFSRKRHMGWTIAGYVNDQLASVLRNYS